MELGYIFFTVQVKKSLDDADGMFRGYTGTLTYLTE